APQAARGHRRLRRGVARGSDLALRAEGLLMDRRWLWLIAAALLVIAAAWLVRIPEPREPLARPQVEMPRHLRPEERQRMLSRLRPPAVDAGVRRNEVRDPMLAALSAGGSGSGVVLEVNALRNSPLGELLLQCLAAREGRGNALDALQRMGIDPLRDVDRVGITEHGVVVSGDFRRADWQGLLGTATGTPYGDRGQIIPVDPSADGGGTLFATRWGDSLLHLGDSEADGRRVLDAVDGCGPAPTPRATWRWWRTCRGRMRASWRTWGRAWVARWRWREPRRVRRATRTQPSCSASRRCRPPTGTPCRWRWRSPWRRSRSGWRSAAATPTLDGDRVE